MISLAVGTVARATGVGLTGLVAVKGAGEDFSCKEKLSLRLCKEKL